MVCGGSGRQQSDDRLDPCPYCADCVSEVSTLFRFRDALHFRMRLVTIGELRGVAIRTMLVLVLLMVAVLLFVFPAIVTIGVRCRSEFRTQYLTALAHFGIGQQMDGIGIVSPWRPRQPPQPVSPWP